MDRFESTQKASVFGIIANAFLLIIKGIIGIITRSQAMIADAFNSAGDVFSSIMTFIGNQIASRPSDDTHNLGHGKAEYIYALLISIVMVISSIVLLESSVRAQYDPNKFNHIYVPKFKLLLAENRKQKPKPLLFDYHNTFLFPDKVQAIYH